MSMRFLRGAADNLPDRFIDFLHFGSQTALDFKAKAAKGKSGKKGRRRVFLKISCRLFVGFLAEGGEGLMNVQELATAHIEKIAAKVIILNNQHLGMVMQWEDKFYQGNRGHTYLGDPDNRQRIYPDYTAVCNSFNVKCERVMFKKDLRAAMQRMLDADEPYVLDIIVPYTEHVLPFIPAGKTVADMIWQA